MLYFHVSYEGKIVTSKRQLDRNQRTKFLVLNETLLAEAVKQYETWFKHVCNNQER